MSSRNQYLNEQQRKIAPRIFQVLSNIKREIIAGLSDYEALEKNAANELKIAGFEPDYVKILDPDNFLSPCSTSTHLRAFVAAWLGKARLIDNIEIR